MTNLVCHIICSLLIWLAVKSIESTLKITHNKPHFLDTAYLTSILFAVHPIHVEAVCGIVGRADILAAITFFLAFIVYNKAIAAKKYMYLYLIIAITLGAVSMLFKENGITVLVSIILLLYLSKLDLLYYDKFISFYFAGFLLML